MVSRESSAGSTMKESAMIVGIMTVGTLWRDG